jgi:CRP/FNR family cyclic AMP-dependent transcriptional regulator
MPTTEDPLPPALLERLAVHGNVRSFAAHAILINEGDQTDTLYILLAGRVKLYSSADNGREIVITELTPGQYFGELSLDGAPRSLSAQALEPTRCCVVAGAELRQFLAAEPDFALHLTHKLIRMARRLTDQVKSLALQDVYGRVVRLLMESSDEVGAERVLRHKLTQQDIADRVGSSREMVNRIMKELAAGGYVSPDPALQRLVIRRKLPAAW